MNIKDNTTTNNDIHIMGALRWDGDVGGSWDAVEGP